MGRVEQDYSAVEHLQAAGEDGVQLVRQIVRYNRSIQGVTYGLFNDEQRQAAGDLAVGAEKFWRNYFPDFIDQEGRLLVQRQIDFFREEAKEQGDEILPADDWSKLNEKNFAKNCQRELAELLIALNLPQVVLCLDKDVSNQEIIQMIGASEKAPGLRFLPGYRKLEWQTQSTAESFKLVLGEKRTDGKIWLENQEGRRFFIASTNGFLGLEKLLKLMEVKITINDLVTTNSLQKTEAVLLDIDETLRIVKSDRPDYEEDVTTPEMIRDRTTLIKKLAQKGIQVGLWSRNDPEDVDEFGDKLEQETGTQITPRLDFGKWPFLWIRKLSWDRYSYIPDGKSEIERRVKESAKKMGLIIDSKLWVKRIVDLFSNVKIRAQRADILEAKAPQLAALWIGNINPEIGKKMWDGGVTVNDSPRTLPSALKLGFNFIHVDHITNLGKVTELVVGS